jgi:hypothetical protein
MHSSYIKTTNVPRELKIVCLCGSTRFKQNFEKANQDLTLHGKIILAPGVFAHADKFEITEKQKKDLDALHFEKINMSDCVLVVNKNNYIGESTRREIDYSNSSAVKVPVFYMYDNKGMIKDNTIYKVTIDMNNLISDKIKIKLIPNNQNHFDMDDDMNNSTSSSFVDSIKVHDSSSFG